MANNVFNVQQLVAIYLFRNDETVSELRKILTDAWRLGTTPWRYMRLRQQRTNGQVPIIILFYHRIANQHPNPWSMDFSTFREQIDWMSERFDMVSLEEAQNRIRGGFNDRPAVAITFDDGYSENCEQGLPYLIERKIPVTYFVTTEHTTKQLPFPHDVEENVELPVNTIESLRALANAGIEIGAHTRTHANIGEVTSPAELFDEIITATREMEELIGRKMRYFAFPYGQYCNLNVDAFRLLKEAGFEAVCSAYGGFNDIGDDAFHLQRIHGDPDFARMKNWLTYDPRISRTDRYDYHNIEGTTDWRTWLDESNKDIAKAPQKKAASQQVDSVDKKEQQLDDSEPATVNKNC